MTVTSVLLSFYFITLFSTGNNGMRRRHLSSRHRATTRSMHLRRAAAVARAPPRELSHAVLRAHATVPERYGIAAR